MREKKEFFVRRRIYNREGFKSRIAKKDGEVMLVAERNVVTVSGTTPIIEVAKLMKKHDFRRIPVTDPGTSRLVGLAVAIDILDFLGGGQKYNIIVHNYDGNFLAAINCPISRIMSRAMYLDKNSRIDDVIEIMMTKRTSAIPIVDNLESMRVIGIVTERDILPMGEEFGISVREAMTRDVITVDEDMSIIEASKRMVQNRLRRLPVVRGDELAGIVTVFDILRMIGYGEFKNFLDRGIRVEDVLREKVSRVMEKNVIAVKPEDDLAKVSQLVKATGYGGFPVVNNGRIVGIVTTSDVIRKIYRG